jgi:hypothetical protein
MPQEKMTNAKRNANNRVQQPTTEVRPDLFSDGNEADMALDWGQVNAEALRTAIASVCRVGGYISFSSAPGGANIKIACSTRGREGKLWCNGETQIRDALNKIWKAASDDHSA